MTGRELVHIVDDEVARLPERYRLPVLLCCVRGLSREEVVEQLGWSDGMVKGRLERGRQRLAKRLAARGLAPSLFLVAPLAKAFVPGELFARTAEQARMPWAAAIGPRISTLAATTSAGRFLPVVTLACSFLVVGLVGWAIASSLGGAPKVPPPASPTPAAESVAVKPDPLPESATMRFGTSRFRQGTAIAGMTVSADGKLAAVTSGGHVHGAVRGFDMTDGHVLFTLPTMGYDAEAIALSPDGKTLAAKGSNTIRLFDAVTGKELRKITLAETNGGTLTEWMTWTPDGKSIALTQGHGRGVVLVDVNKGEVARTFAHDNVVFAAAFSPDGKLMAAGGYDADKGKYFTRILGSRDWHGARRLPHPEGGLRHDRLFAGWQDHRGRWRQWVGARLGDGFGQGVEELCEGEPRRAQCGVRAGRSHAAALGSTDLRLFDTKTYEQRFRVERRVIGLRFTPDSKVVTGAVSGTIHQWDATTGKLLTPQSAGESAVDQVLVTRDGRRLVTRGQDGDAQLWDARTGEHLRGSMPPGSVELR